MKDAVAGKKTYLDDLFLVTNTLLHHTLLRP